MDLKKTLSKLNKETLSKETLQTKQLNSIKYELYFAKLTDKAFKPLNFSPRAVGFVLRNAYDLIVEAEKYAVCLTDLQIKLPFPHYWRVLPFHGIKLKNVIEVEDGAVRQDYHNNFSFKLFNRSSEDVKVERGDRIAVLKCGRNIQVELVQLDKLDYSVLFNVILNK